MLARFALAVAVLGPFSPAAAAGPALGWAPARTWVFAAGLLEWADGETWPPFPDARAGRADRKFVEFFRAAGVPDDHVVALFDRQATLKQIRRRYSETLARVGPDDLLVVYFAGHGDFDPGAGRYAFVPYDARKKNGSDLWPVRAVVAEAGRSRAGRVLFLADCCYSGGLVAEAARLPADRPVAVLSSAFAHNTSTGGWTFTEGVVRGLRGDPQADEDGNGAVELAEVARGIEREMAFVEEQKSVFVARNGFPDRMVVAAATGKRNPAVGRHVEVLWRGGWWKAVVTKEDAAGTHVRYVSDGSTEVVADPARVRPFRPTELPAGTKLRVVWEDGVVYPATVRRSWYGLHFVHYPGYGPEYDEWVSPDRIRGK
jgi:hypothetical protein